VVASNWDYLDEYDLPLSPSADNPPLLCLVDLAIMAALADSFLASGLGFQRDY